MALNKKSIEDIDVKGKKVLARCDFNVPLDGDGNITDDKRIVESLPTIKYLLGQGAKLILCSHLGRPKGEFNMKYSLKPVAKRLSELLGMDVPIADDVIGDSAKALAAKLQDGQCMLLENLRFHKEEEKNDDGFGKSARVFCRSVCQRRVRHQPPRPRLHRRRNQIPARRLRLSASEGDRRHGRRAGQPRRVPLWPSWAARRYRIKSA